MPPPFPNVPQSDRVSAESRARTSSSVHPAASIGFESHKLAEISRENKNNIENRPLIAFHLQPVLH